MDISQFLMMRQEVGLLAVILLVFLYDLFMPKRAQAHLPIFTCIVFVLYAVVCPLFLTHGTFFGGMFESTAATAGIKIILSIGTAIVLVQAIQWANSEFTAVRRGEFYVLLLITLLGMHFMVSARHFLLFILGLEMASLPLVALVAFDKKHYESHEAAAKYLFTAVFSSAILMMGLSFVYALGGGSLYFSDIAANIANSKSALLIIALAFVISGVGFKLSLVPFHLWTADVYQGAPTSVTAYLSVISKGSAAFAFFVILCQVFGTVYSEVWEWMLYAVIILTITIGNLFAIRQKNLKRFLAFSSISQAGYIVLGVIADNTLGLSSLMYYILVYIVSNLAAFGVIQAIENKTGKVNVDDYNELYKTNPKLAFVMMIAMFSLAGIPPFAGFFSKFFIFSAAIQQATPAMYVLVLIALINTIISLYYYLLVVKAMFINKNDNPIETFKSAPSERIALFVCLISIMLLGIASCVYTHIVEAVNSSAIVL